MTSKATAYLIAKFFRQKSILQNNFTITRYSTNIKSAFTSTSAQDFQPHHIANLSSTPSCYQQFAHHSRQLWWCKTIDNCLEHRPQWHPLTTNYRKNLSVVLHCVAAPMKDFALASWTCAALSDSGNDYRIENLSNQSQLWISSLSAFYFNRQFVKISKSATSVRKTA
jgi:hypothetical protein